MILKSAIVQSVYEGPFCKVNSRSLRACKSSVRSVARPVNVPRWIRIAILTGSWESLAEPARQAGSMPMTITSATCNRTPPWHESCGRPECDGARRRSDERGSHNEYDDEVRLREPDHARPWGARLHSVRATMLPRLWRLPRICHVLRPMCRRAPWARGDRSYRALESEPDGGKLIASLPDRD